MSALSSAQLAANRANAQLSTGPKTEAGKAKVSLNAVKTGLTGRTVLLPSDDVAAYQATIARLTNHWQPATEEESVLVQSLADIDWRMQRIPVLEYGIYAMGAEEFADEFAAEADPNIRRSKIQTRIFLTYHKKLMSLQSQDARLRRQREQDEARLRQLQGDRKYKEAQQRQEQQIAAANVARDRQSAAPSHPRGFEFQPAAANHNATPRIAPGQAVRRDE